MLVKASCAIEEKSACLRGRPWNRRASLKF
jgi:hypothetical protein